MITELTSTLSATTIMGVDLINTAGLIEMLSRFILNIIVVWIITHFFYYPKSHRRDYYFTFMLISISIFFLIYLLGGMKLKIGFALGLFAIFGIIRYRTESMPVREMTYLFMIISMSVINALAVTISYAELIIVNGVFLLATWIFESHALMKHLSTKLIQYDRIELIKPDRRAELKADLEARTGLNIEKIEVGGIDFLKDMAMIRISYEPEKNEINNIDDKLKISREEWTNV